MPRYNSGITPASARAQLSMSHLGPLQFPPGARFWIGSYDRECDERDMRQHLGWDDAEWNALTQAPPCVLLPDAIFDLLSVGSWVSLLLRASWLKSRRFPQIILLRLG